MRLPSRTAWFLVATLIWVQATAAGAQLGPLSRLCEATQDDLYQLSPLNELIDEVMSEVRDAIASETREYVRDLTHEEARAFRARLRRISVGEIEALPAPLAEAAKRALASALFDVFSTASLSEYQRRLDRVSDRVGTAVLPEEPSLPVVSENLTRCRELVTAVSAFRNYQAAWIDWTWELSRLVELPSTSPFQCESLSPEKYAAIARNVARMEEPLTQIGLLIDTAALDGTATATRFFTASEELATTALTIESRLKDLGRRARSLHDSALPRFRNVEANSIEIVGPAMLEICATERARARRSPPPLVPPPAPPPPPPRMREIPQWVMTERGTLRREGASQTWKETFDRDPRVFTFQQQELNHGVLVLHDATRNYTFRVPLTRNSCVPLLRGNAVENPCYYRVQDVNYMQVPY